METWQLRRIGLTVSSNISEPQGDVYVGSVQPGNWLAGSFSASRDSSDESQTLMPGTRLICVFTLGDPAATATMSIFGTREYAV